MMDVRTAERQVWDELGLEPVVHQLALDRVGTTVRVQEVGEGRPVVFVHGASVSGTSWADLVAVLPRVRCLLVDRPGCGGSEPLPGPVNAARQLAVADDLVADVLDALGLPSASVVGTSRGGLDAVRGAAAHPERVERLLLIGWCFGTPGSPAPWWVRAGALPGAARLSAAAPVTRRTVRGSLRRFGLGRALAEGSMSDAAVDWLVALYRDTDTLRHEMTAGAALVSLRDGYRPGLLPRHLLESVRAPTRILLGSDDPFGSPDVMRRLAEAIPDADLHVAPNAGHAPWLDEPEICVGLVQSFLGRGG